MDFVDSAGTRYQLTETAESVAPAKKPVWPWVVGGLAVAGGLVWMASASTRSTNPIDPEIEVLITEVRDPETSFERLVRLAEHREIEVRRALLDNPNLCPTDDQNKLNVRLLEKLAEEFPEEVATHPVFVLHALVEPNEKFEGVLKEVVQRTKDVGLIEHVLRTWGPSSAGVRNAVAMNPRAPENVLRLLGNPKTEPDDNVRQAVALNPNTPVDLLRIFGNQQTESSGWVRQAVAQNPNTPVDVLRILANQKTESHRWVRWAVASNPKTPEDLLRTLGNETTESNEDVRLAVAQSPRTPVDVLRTLGNPATESSGNVRQCVAKTPRTPVDVLRLLGNPETESAWWVRQAVASNPSTPEDTLRSMGNKKNESNKFVREAAQKALADRGLA